MISLLADGRTLMKVFLPHAATVEVIGTFTDWRSRAAAMTRSEAGWWSAVLTIEPGQHEFSYLVDHAIWLADYAAHGVRLCSSGQWLSQLTVAPTNLTGVGGPRVAV
jgi:1,4-alpha-glucan branching enzyme